MENISNISSEMELLGLRNEGKISEDEYEELLETLRKTSKADAGPFDREQPRPVRTCGLAIASLIFALVLGPFGLIPAAICGHLALRKIEKDATLGGRGLALAGLIVGYSIFGLSIVFASPIVLYWAARVESRQASNAEATVKMHKIKEEITTVEFRSFPLDSTEGLITQTGIQIDNEISNDGNGSLRIDAIEPTTIRLFETGDIDIENARLIYQAKVRTENVEGLVYLEMWCHFTGKGEFFSRGLTNPISGTKDWTTMETPFLLKQGENPDNVKLNLVITDKGMVWIDDIHLLKGILP